MAEKRTNYLNNNSLLDEIHASKLSYSWVLSKRYSKYDIVVQSVEDITDDVIEEAKRAYFKRTKNEKINNLYEKSKHLTKKQAKIEIESSYNIESVKTSDLVFCVMTNEHVPLTTSKAGLSIKQKTNFPPFKYYSYIDEKLTEVARSHWEGDLDTGHFSISKGKTTDKLTSMYLLLVNRISQRPNFRGYTYLDDMKSFAVLRLFSFGLLFDESKSSNPFAYYSEATMRAFWYVLKLEKKVRDLRDKILVENGQNPSFSYLSDHEHSEECFYYD